jgi:peptidoglycan-associated lipoprotein
MKRALILILVVLVAVTFATSCKPKPKPKSVPTPQAKEQPRVERIEPQVPAQKPQLREEDVFMAKSLEDLNNEKPLAMIHFDYDESAIRPDARPLLQSNGAWLKKWASVKILIEGHCDERGTEDYNLALGQKRAQAAQEFLAGEGISADRIKIISFGKSQPLDMGKDEAAFARNRRAQFVIIEK